MHRWGYSVLIIFTLIFAACGRKADEPVAKPTPAEVPAKDKLQATVKEDKPSTTKESVPVRKNTSESGIRLPEVNPLEVEGNLTAAGSSTVFVLIKAIYERFVQEGYAGILKLDGLSSGAGFKLFCQEGTSDIVLSSRPVKNEEIESCAAIGRTPVEFLVGNDGLAVVVNRDNDFVTNVTLQELAAIFTAEKWSDVNPKWPNEPIKRFAPAADTGTFQVFVEKVFDKKGEPLLNAPNTEFISDDDNDIVQGVLANKYGLGLFGYPFYQQNAKILKILSIEGVEPNAKTVAKGEYPLARPIFIYSDAKIIKEKPQVGAFINFFLTNVNEEVGGVGYFPPSQSDLDEAKVNLLKAMGYETFLEQNVGNSP